MKYLELTIPGRPVPWARPRVSKHGGMFTAKKQAEHRKNVAWLIKEAARRNGGLELNGPLLLQVQFIYGKYPMTLIKLSELKEVNYHTSRPDLDNLQKEIFEAIEDSEILGGEDSQISMVIAAKVKR